MLTRFMVERKRFVSIILGNILLGIGIGIFKYSNMGNDPFTAMCLSLYGKFHVSYALFLIGLNCFIFVGEAIWGKKYIGIGTFVNWFLLGYVVEFTIKLCDNGLPVLESFGLRLLAVIGGVILASLGLSLYQSADGGVAPYDSLALIVNDRLRIPYFWSRIFFDAVCTLIAFLAGGLIGLGTVVCAFGLGPVVNFFNKTVTEKWLKKEDYEIKNLSKIEKRIE